MPAELRNEILAAVRAVRDAIASLGVPAAIIGGIGVIARGVPRLTDDVDASIAAADLCPLEDLVRRLAAFGIQPRMDDVVAFARRRHVLLMRHAPTGVDVDLSLAWIPWEHEALERAETLRFGAIPIRVPTAEDLLVYKLVAARPRDIEDASALAQLHHASIDFARVRTVITEFCAALEDDSRLAALDRIERSTKP